MADKLKVMTIVGTRPEIIRLSATIKACDQYFNHILVHTGQNYDYTLNQIFFDELGIRAPNYYLESAGSHLGETIGKIISSAYEVLSREQPEAMLILGDTNSALSAIVAKRLKVPIFHMEAGNRCWDWNVPEMINRKVVDHIADINLPYTEHSRRYLLSEGIDGKTIFVTGSPMPEVIKNYRKRIESSDVLKRLALKEKAYFLLSAHREENIDIESNFNTLMKAINSVAEKYRMPVIYSLHPRSKKLIKERNHKFHPLVREIDPFGYIDYSKLQMNAFCVLSDSGTLSEESALLKFPAVLIRTSTERPEVIDKGSLVIGGIDQEGIEQAIEVAVKSHAEGYQFTPPADYCDTDVSMKVVKIIQSYAKIVRMTVWKNY